MNDRNECQGVELLLDEFEARRLAPGEHDRVSAHLARCSACREVREAQRALRDEAARLPRTVEPPRDLWPGIAAAIAADGARTPVRPGRPVPSGPLPRTRARLALVVGTVAALLLVAAAIGTTWYARGPVSRGPVPNGTRAALDVAALGEGAYGSADAQLRAAFEQRRDRLDPRTVAVIEENLQVIDHALAEAKSALARDPGNRRAEVAYARLQTTRLDVLRNATLATGAF